MVVSCSAARQSSAIVRGSLWLRRFASHEKSENLAREMSFTIEKEVVVYIVFNFGLIEGENHRFSTFEVNTKRLSEWEKWIP